MAEPTIDLVWLTGLAAEIAADMAGRTARLRRHVERPFAWLDAGGSHSWVAEATPGASHVRRGRPIDEEAWRPWGGRRTDGAAVAGASVLGGDRALVVALRWQTRLGDDVRSELVVELGGRTANVVLVAADGTAVDVLRPVSGKVNRLRQVLPGRPYMPPPALGRVRADAPWPWGEADDAPVAFYMVHGFLAMSRAWADEICCRCGLEPRTPAKDVGDEGRRALEHEAHAMIGAAEPVVLVGDDGRTIDHVGFRPSCLPSERVQVMPSFAAAIEAVWANGRGAEARPETIGAARAQRCERRHMLEGRRRSLLAEVARSERVGEYRRLADLIMSHVARIPPEATEVELVDWFDPGQRVIRVRLDPSQPPAKQAERLYRKARRLREAAPLVRARLERTERLLAELDALPDDEPLRREAIVARRQAGQDHPTRDEQRIHPRRYRTRDGGWLVLVGRNDRENDILSLKLAAPDDIWFHAQGCPGSHVVLRREGRPEMPSRAAIGEVAALAGYWSKARGSSKVGVSYTLAKHVSKPKGASPGTVTIRQEKLVTVPPALLPLADNEEG